MSLETDIFQKNRDTKRNDLYEAILGQKIDPDSMAIDQPDKPEIDQQRRDKLRRLTQVSSIAQGIDALTDAIGVSASNDYAPASTNVGNLGVRSVDQLAHMDTNYRNNLQDWKNSVFQTNKYNAKARQQTNKYNTGIDTKVAQAKYKDAQNDLQAQREAQQAEQDNRLRNQDDYRSLAGRMISQGKVKAGMLLAAKGGLSTQEIAGMTGGGGNEQSPEYQTKRNMISRYNALMDDISGNESQHYTTDGKPRSAKARQVEFLEDQLGSDLYNPIFQPEDSGPSGETMVTPANQQAASRGLDPDKVREGMYSKESLMSENQDLVSSFRDATDQQQQQQALSKLIDNWRQVGLNDNRIREAYQAIVSGNSPQSQNSQQSQGQQKPILQTNQTPTTAQSDSYGQNADLPLAGYTYQQQQQADQDIEALQQKAQQLYDKQGSLSRQQGQQIIEQATKLSNAFDVPFDPLAILNLINQ